MANKINVAKNLKKPTLANLEKIVINAGIGKRSQDTSHFSEKILPRITEDLARIAGQVPQLRSAKKSIAGFGVRQGDPVGLRITLRGKRMVDFLDRLIKIVLPRMPDFRGVKISSIDEGGALHLGFREQYVFPEIDSEKSTYAFSLGVNIVPKEKDRDSALSFYREIGVPLQQPDKSDK